MAARSEAEGKRPLGLQKPCLEGRGSLLVKKFRTQLAYERRSPSGPCSSIPRSRRFHPVTPRLPMFEHGVQDDQQFAPAGHERRHSRTRSAQEPASPDRPPVLEKATVPWCDTVRRYVTACILLAKS